MNRVKIREAGRLVTLLFATAFVLDASAATAAIEISTKPTANMTCSGGICTPTAKKAVLNVTDLANMLASGDVTIKSDNIAQDIEINAKLSWTGTKMLTLDAYRSITFGRPVEVLAAGALTITTNHGGAGGDYRFLGQGHVRFHDSHSGLYINGKLYRLLDSLKSLIRELRHTDGSGLFLAQMNNWNIIQHWSAPPINKSFNGTFEGLGNTISNLTVNSGGEAAGLFFSIYFNGIVRDVRIDNANISGSAIGGQFIGVLAAGNLGTITNCFVSGHALAPGTESYVGGLVSGNAGHISYSGSTVTVSGGTGNIVGGLVGENQSLTGLLGVIDQSYSTGAVTSGDDSMAGSLVGYDFGSIISNSYAISSVSGGSNAFVGGLIGKSADNTDERSIPAVAASYSTGAVSGGTGSMAGGLIGSDAADAKNTNLYWDMDTSGISDPSKGAGNIADDPGITGLTDAQLKSGLPSGIDNTVWKQSATRNNGYPYLIANPPPK